MYTRRGVNGAEEELEIAVSKISRESYGQILFTGELQQDGQVNKHFRAGDFVNVRLYDLSRFELRNGNEIVAEGRLAANGE